VITEKEIAQSSNFEKDEYDFSRCICNSCGKRINIEELSPGERFECPFCKASNIVGQNAVSDVRQNAGKTSATITDGKHAYAEDTNDDGSIPEIIGGCRIEKVIGEGGMGRVYLSTHSNLGISVAIKTMLPGYGTVKSYAERFFREARTAAKINHPNVVRVYDCGNENNTLFIVMEYVSGGNVATLLRKKGKLPSYTVINIAENICRALVEAQKFGIIHRDIKPANIMCGEDGVYKLADLGLAKQISPENADKSLTMESTGLGTPLYMPPEQSIDAKSCDIRSDIYALGVTLYHLACGKPPFESDSQLELFKMHSEVIPESPTELNPDIPEQLEKIIGKCMGKTPDMRYSDPKDMLLDLKRMREGEEIPSLIPLGEKSLEELEKESEAHSRKFLPTPLIITVICLPMLVIIVLLSLSLFKPKVPYTSVKTTPEEKTEKKIADFSNLEKPVKTEKSKDVPNHLPVEENKQKKEPVADTRELDKTAKTPVKSQKNKDSPANLPVVQPTPQVDPFEKILSSIAADIISAKFADAVMQCDTALKDVAFDHKKEELNEILEQVKTLQNTKQIIKKLLLANVGKKVGMLIPKYKNYTIDTINGKIISLVKKSNKVKIGTKVPITAITTEGRAYCIRKQNENAAKIYRGICEFRKMNYTNAEKYFKSSGTLSESLLKQLPVKVIEKPSAINSVDNILLEDIPPQLFYGKIHSWNPETRQIKLEYNFSDKIQLQDWIGRNTIPEIYRGAMLFDIAKERFGLAMFKAPMILSELSFDLLPTNADLVWWFNNRGVMEVEKEMYGAMRHNNYHEESSLYGKVGRTSNSNSNDVKQRYKIKIAIEGENLVWRRNGKVFLQHYYTQGGEVLAIGGYYGQILFDNIILEGILNKEWLVHEQENLKKITALQRAEKEGECKLPEDAKYFKGHAYKYYPTFKTWKEAKEFCEQQGGHLVTISDNEENTFARSLTGNYKKQVRIGLQRTGPKSSDFIWCTGEKLRYRNWLQSQPNNSKSKTVVYDIGRKWNDWHTRAMPFICEWEVIKKDAFKLIVTTKTSDLDYARTDSWIYVLINGNESLKYGLDDYDKNDFERGQVDRFELPVEYPISKIKSMKIMIDGKNDWAYDWISFQVVQGDKKSKVYEFKTKKGKEWLSTDPKEGEKERTYKLKNVKVVKTLRKNDVGKKALPQAGRYPEGTFEWNGHHYCVLKRPMSYKNAEAACRELGGHILSIDNRKENEYFYTLAANKNTIYKLDVNNRENTKKWRNWKNKKPAYMPKGYKPRFLNPEMEKGAAVIGYTSFWYIFPIGSNNQVICEWDQ